LSIIMIFFALTLALALYILYLFIPQWDSWLWRAKRKARANGRVCCLTFDDGPSKWTPGVLDILKKAGIRATFFVTGERAAAYPDIVRKISGEGHVIGSHTMTHRKLTFVNGDTLEKEIAGCNDTLKSITGVSPSLFRAPHGFKRPFFKRTLSKMGLTLIPWTKGIWDTDMPPADELIRRVSKKFEPLEILLLHDGIDNRKIPQNRDSMVAALPKIIEEYRKRGYTFMTISELSLPFVRGG